MARSVLPSGTTNPEQSERDRLTMMSPCALCLAKSGEPCVGVRGSSKGKVVDYCHSERKNRGRARWVNEKVVSRKDDEMRELEESISSLEKLVARANRLAVMRNKVVLLSGEVAQIEESAGRHATRNAGVPPEGDETVDDLRSAVLSLLDRLDEVDAIIEIRSRLDDLAERVTSIERRASRCR